MLTTYKEAMGGQKGWKKTDTADPGHHGGLSLLSQPPSRRRTRLIHFISVVLVLLMRLTSNDKTGPERPKLPGRGDDVLSALPYYHDDLYLLWIAPSRS